jgi:hypothetical protein
VPVATIDSSVAVTFSHDHDYNDRAVPVQELLTAANKRIEELEERLRNMEVERFGLERFSSNPHMIKFYTGFPNYQCLKNFFIAITPYAVRMTTWSQAQRSSSSHHQRSTVGKLMPIDQLFLFLHKLRVGSLDKVLRCCLNEAIEGEERMEIGKEFHTLGAAKLKARRPVTVQVLRR